MSYQRSPDAGPPRTGLHPGRRPAAEAPLWVILVGFALLGANGFYLSSVTALTWWLGTTQQTYFYLLMVLLHLALGFALIVPFLVFGLAHLATSWKRPNRAAVRYGLGLAGRGPGGPGLGPGPGAARRVRGPRPDRPRRGLLAPRARPVGGGRALRQAPPGRAADPLGMGAAASAWRSWRRSSSRWALLHSHDPRSFGVKGPREGKQYFFPSEAVTANGKFIPAETLMMDDYCLKCHQDAYNGWFHSAHHFSSFNNKAYLFERPRDPAGLAQARRRHPAPPAGARAATTRCRSSRASSTTRTTTT